MPYATTKIPLLPWIKGQAPTLCAVCSILHASSNVPFAGIRLSSALKAIRKRLLTDFTGTSIAAHTNFAIATNVSMCKIRCFDFDKNRKSRGAFRASGFFFEILGKGFFFVRISCRKIRSFPARFSPLKGTKKHTWLVVKNTSHIF